MNPVGNAPNTTTPSNIGGNVIHAAWLRWLFRALNSVDHWISSNAVLVQTQDVHTFDPEGLQVLLGDRAMGLCLEAKQVSPERLFSLLSKRLSIPQTVGLSAALIQDCVLTRLSIMAQNQRYLLLYVSDIQSLQPESTELLIRLCHTTPLRLLLTGDFQRAPSISIQMARHSISATKFILKSGNLKPVSPDQPHDATKQNPPPIPTYPKTPSASDEAAKSSPYRQLRDVTISFRWLILTGLVSLIIVIGTNLWPKELSTKKPPIQNPAAKVEKPMVEKPLMTQPTLSRRKKVNAGPGEENQSSIVAIKPTLHANQSVETNSSPLRDVVGLAPSSSKLGPSTSIVPQPIDAAPQSETFTNASAFTLQLAVFSTLNGREQFLKGVVGDENLRVIEIVKDGKLRYVICYGQYETRYLAQQAITTLPASLQNSPPYLRQVGSLAEPK